MRVLFTGGSGKAGKHVVAYLLAQGHRVLNVDRVPLAMAGVDNLIADITDSGQMFNAMSSYAGFDEMEAGTGVPRFDAVVHFAAVPRILIVPDNETFRVNTMGTYNVVEAAVKLGIPKIIVASSETTYGVCFSDGTVDPKVLPLDEDYDVDPMDSYGLSKVVGEKTARAFAERFGADIYALRIGNVLSVEDYANFPAWLDNPLMRKRNAWSHIDARDLGQIVDLCVRKDGLGYQVFNAVNDNITAREPAREFLARVAPGTPITGALEGFDAPLSNAKIRKVLGFKQNHDWRDLV